MNFDLATGYWLLATGYWQLTSGPEVSGAIGTS